MLLSSGRQVWSGLRPRSRPRLWTWSWGPWGPQQGLKLEGSQICFLERPLWPW